MSDKLTALLWRRGRGFLTWEFEWQFSDLGNGWYHHGRKNVYRLTFDHNYPYKPIWLGTKCDDGAWITVEDLYTPVVLHMPGYNIVPDHVSSPWKGKKRTEACKQVIRQVPVE